MTNPVSDFLAFEAGYLGHDAIVWTQNHMEVPVFAVGAYLWFVFYFPKLQDWHYLPAAIKAENLPDLKKPMAVWSLGLALFSMVGASRVVPVLLGELFDGTKGATFYERFLFSACGEPARRYKDGPVGLWTMLFIYSKFPELVDTVFLVLQRKKVIFLHWFHHCTVLLYCWHAFHHEIAPGLWFAAMNYSVHSVMYSYYFMSNMGMRHVVRPFAPLITTVQILQMVGGIAVTVTAARAHSADPASCYTDAANWKLGLGMYGVYLMLFCVLFANLYCTRAEKATLNKRGSFRPRKVKWPTFMSWWNKLRNYHPSLDVGDAAGGFQGHEDEKARAKTIKAANAAAAKAAKHAAAGDKPGTPRRRSARSSSKR
jgi:elongation of very long chain fatty acids protein 6